MTPEKISDQNLPEELQRTLIELENYKKQLEILEQQDRMLEATLVELNSTQSVLSSVKTYKPGKEILVPLGSGSYIRGELKDTQKVLIGVGVGVSIEKTIDDAKKIHQEREASMSKSRVELQKKINELTNKISELSPKAEELLSGARRH